MSMGEIIVIIIVAILVLGPDKLPSTIAQIAKIMKALKKQVNEAKESIEKELQLSELQEQSKKYKDEFSEYNQNIRKKLSFEEFDELKKEILADTKDIKENLSSIEKDLQQAPKKTDEKNPNTENTQPQHALNENQEFTEQKEVKHV